MNKNKTFRVASLVIALCLILTSTVFASSKKDGMKFEQNNFKWNKSCEYMRDKGIMKGYGDGNFGLKDYVKRGDITVMIVRAFQMSAILGDIENKFPDVPVDSYYYDAIATAKHYGIAKGDGKHFNPKKYVTIGEAIALIERSVVVANSNVIVDKDADLEELYKDADLKAYASRDDIAKMLYYILTGNIFDEDEDETVDEDNNTENIVYETENNMEITFDENDFKDAFYDFKDVNDEDDKLDYVKFKLPSVTNGKLYYDYDEKSDDNQVVKNTYEYFYDSSSDREISEVSFVPKLNYSGTFYIDYTAYDEDGNSYEGKIKIIVNDGIVVSETINYKTDKNIEINLDSTDFENAFEDVTDEDFDYVKFVLPDKKYGKLYYDYESASDNKSLVIENKEYNYDGIDKITFVPASEYTGNVNIDYTAHDINKCSYNGKIKIAVK